MPIIRRTLALKTEDWLRLDALAKTSGYPGWHAYVRSLAQSPTRLVTQPAEPLPAWAEPAPTAKEIASESTTKPKKGPTKFGELAPEDRHFTPVVD